LLLFLLTHFAGQFFLFSCVMVVRLSHEGFLVGEHLTRTLLHNWTVGRHEVRGSCAPNHRQSSALGRGALSGAHCSTTPRELPFEGGDSIAKRSVLGFLIAQSLAEVEGNDHEKHEQSD
jgi:hypothetical protein